MLRNIIIFLFTCFSSLFLNAQEIFLTKEGKVTFVSDAPLELITASSNELMGAIDLKNNRFAFKVINRSLKGFNNALQQEHFYENYMEVDLYNSSTFTGKIIEEIDLNQKGVQHLRAKGVLSVHGIEQDRIINAEIEINGDSIYLYSKFEIPLEDHNIRIPSIVYQKIAENISVEVRATLLPQKVTD